MQRNVITQSAVLLQIPDTQFEEEELVIQEGSIIATLKPETEA